MEHMGILVVGINYIMSDNLRCIISNKSFENGQPKALLKKRRVAIFPEKIDGWYDINHVCNSKHSLFSIIREPGMLKAFKFSGIATNRDITVSSCDFQTVITKIFI